MDCLVSVSQGHGTTVSQGQFSFWSHDPIKGQVEKCPNVTKLKAFLDLTHVGPRRFVAALVSWLASVCLEASGQWLTETDSSILVGNEKGQQKNNSRGR